MRTAVPFRAGVLPQTRQPGGVRPEAERFTTASLALEEVLQLLNPDIAIPRSLFPHGSHVSRLVRLGQLAFTGVQLLGLPLLKGKSVAIVCGDGLAFQNGWVRISLQENWWTVLKAMARLQPALIVSVPDGSIPEFFVRTGVDPKGDLSSFINQNGHPVIRGRRAEGSCIIHYGKSPDSRATVSRHAQGLAGAHAMLGQVLPGLLPTVYAERQPGHAALLIMQELAGHEPQITALSDQKLDEVITAAFDPLRAIYKHCSSNLSPFRDDFLDHEMHELLRVLPEYRQHIVPSIILLRNWIKKREPTALVTHGDYAPRNLLFDPTQSHVVGIIDWEWFWKHGIVGFDALKLLLEISAERKRITLIGALAHFIETRATDACILRHLQIVKDTYGSSRDDLWHIAIIIWLRVLWMGCVETSPSTPEWLDDAVVTPARAIATAAGSV